MADVDAFLFGVKVLHWAETRGVRRRKRRDRVEVMDVLMVLAMVSEDVFGLHSRALAKRVPVRLKMFDGRE